MAQDDGYHVSGALRAFSQAKQLAFGLLVSERLLPYLYQFSVSHNRDDTAFKEALNLAWNSLAYEAKAVSAESARNECASSVPDTEDYDDPLVSHALNAALSICELVDFVTDNDIEHIVKVSNLAFDSIDLHLNNMTHSVITTPDDERRIQTDPLRKRELSAQRHDIEFISTLPSRMSRHEVSLLRSRAAKSVDLLTDPAVTTRSTG